MASLDDLFEDFSRLKEFSEAQVVELVEDFRQINEKLEEDLPSGLEGYAEFLKDKGLGGSGSKVEKLIKSSISSECAQIISSDAYKLSSAYLISSYQSNRAKEKSYFTLDDNKEVEPDVIELTPFKLEDHDPLSFLRIVLGMSNRKNIRNFRGFRTFRLPWLSSTSLGERARATGELPTHSLLLGRIQTLLKIEKKEAYESLFESLNSKEELSKQSKNKPFISFFRDDYNLRILESLARNEFESGSNTALSLWITSKLSELISQATKTDATAALKERSGGSVELDREETSKLIKDNEKFLVDHLIPQTAAEINKILPKDNFKAWQDLDEAFNKYRKNLFHLSVEHTQTISRLLGEEDDLLYSEIFEFLRANGLNTVAIPTIDELGKYKGGYSLVKKISQNNGLKAVRRKYVPWAMKKVAGDTSSIKDEGASSSPEQTTIDNNSRELLDEIFKLQSRLRDQQNDFNKARMELDALRGKQAYEYKYNERRKYEKLENIMLEKKMLAKEQDSLRRQLSESEERHRMEIKMMAEQIEKLKKKI